MASSLDEVRRQLASFLAGGDFMPLWGAVMDATEHVDEDSQLSDADRGWFDELYELVYMGADDPVSPQDRRDGVIGATELRQQIREFHLDRPDVRPA